MTKLRGSARGALTVPDSDGYPRGDRVRSGVALQFFGMFHGRSSIANVCNQVARELLSNDVRIALHSTNGPDFSDRTLATQQGVDPDAPVALYWGIPETVPAGFFRHNRTIGSFVCENRDLPDRWVRVCNRFDQLIVPSVFCKEAFRAAGVEPPIQILHHGLEPEYQPVGQRPERAPFVFFNALGETFFERKGTDVLVRAFKRAFKGRDDVVLRLRTGSAGGVVEALRPLDLSMHEAPVIQVEATQDLNTANFAALYSQVHCTVHPTRGEGFGLIPLQSLACGTPVICPDHSGLSEYVSDQIAEVLLSTPPPAATLENPRPLFGISEEELINALQRVEADYDQALQKAQRASGNIREQWAWPRVLAPLLDLLKQGGIQLPKE